MRLLRVVALAGMALAAALSPAMAEDNPDAQFGRNAKYWEVRLGGGAYDFGPATPQIFDGGVINGEILAPSPDFLDFLGSPRPYLGTDIALSDDAIHVIYFGLNWELYLTQRFYLGFSGGGSWNSSPVTTNSSGTTKDLGSSTLFHLQASIGYDFASDWSIQLFYNHYSNANLDNNNTGLESMGGRVAKRF